MSSAPTTPTGRDSYGMTAENRHRLKTQTNSEIMQAALADPDAQPASPEQLARGGRPLAKVVRHKLHMSQEEFAAAYGIPLDALVAWERQQAEPTATELAYLRLIERSPEAAKLVPA
jgi:putative transcriptional regulator